MDTIQHNPARLYTATKPASKLYSTNARKLKGKRQIISLQSEERGSLVTVVTCMSPIGPFIPPLLVFLRKNVKEELMSGSPPGSCLACQPSGWIQSDIFPNGFFISSNIHSRQKKILLS